jgi:hypothetical protein
MRPADCTGCTDSALTDETVLAWTLFTVLIFIARLSGIHCARYLTVLTVRSDTRRTHSEYSEDSESM